MKLRFLLALLAVLLALAPEATAEATDYEVELAGIERKLAALEGGEGGEAGAGDPTVQAGRKAFQLYRRASLTASFADFRAAETALDEAIALAPHPDLVLLKAQLDFKLHRLARAKAAVTALAASPDPADSPEARLLRADMAFQEGRYAEARKGYEAALRQERTWDNLARLAWLESRTGNPAGAEKLYVEAQEGLTAKEMRSYAWLELQRGLLDLEAGRHAEALAHYEQAGRAYSGYWLIDEHVAEVLDLLGRTEEAITLYRQIVERTHNPEFLSALAAILDRSDPAAAEPLYREAQRLFEEQSRLYPEAALGHFLEHRIESKDPGPDLLAMARRNVELRPNGDSKLLLAKALLKLGDPAAARKVIGEIQRTSWRTPELERVAREVQGALRAGE